MEVAASKPELTPDQIYDMVNGMKRQDLAEYKIAVIYSAIFAVALTWVADLDLVWQVNITWIVAVSAFIAHFIIRKKERN